VTNLRLPGQYDERLLASVGLQGPYYNWNRWYLPGVGRYLEVDPPALPGAVDPTGIFFSRAPEWYAYARGNPLSVIDPRGLYGTKCCAYYQKRCAEAGGSYYCQLAKLVCEGAPTPDRPNNWSNCVRKCLQDKDHNRCGDSSKKSGFGDLVDDHLDCWKKCFDPEKNPTTGEPQPDDDPAACPAP